MDLDIGNIVKKWEADHTRFTKLSKIIVPILKSDVAELELFPEVHYRVKDLLSIIRKIKKKKKEKKYSYDDLNDKLGIRIICTFVEDLDILHDYITKTFNIRKAELKKDSLDHNRLDYISNHYDLSISSSNNNYKRALTYSDLIFEIQVKTLNQHAWSSTSHALSYKQEANLSDKFKRKIFRLLSLYEIADDEFSIVNNTLKQNDENTIYRLLRKTEGKTYKYAKVDFDRETSISNLNILLRYFSTSETNLILKEFDDFIDKNDIKIRQIFAENKHRIYEIPILTQPEIFIIWFALEKFSFSITDNWNNDFDEEELYQIQILWGGTIDD